MSSRPSIIHPYVELNSSRESERAFKSVGFAITALDLDLLKSNWLRLHIRWEAPKGKTEYKVKYATYGGSSFSGGGGSESTGVELRFEELGAPVKSKPTDDQFTKEFNASRKASLEAGVYIRTGRRRNPPRLGYGYRFFENLKYGVNVFFSPDGWNNGDGDEVLFSWTRRAPKKAQNEGPPS